MATQIEAPFGTTNGANQMCPYCGQPLLDRRAVSHLHESERRMATEVETAAHVKAAEMAKELTARHDEAVARLKTELAADREKLATQKTAHAEDMRQLRLEVTNRAKAEAVRDAESRVRTELRTRDRAISTLKKQVGAQLTQIEKRKSELAADRAKLAAQKTQHAEEIRQLRVEAAKKAKAEAARDLRSELNAKDRELSAKDRAISSFKDQIVIQARQIEHLTAGERGELNENELFSALQDAFPDDRIDRVARGRAGGDILHRVCVRTGDGLQEAGLIVYECKDTARWSNSFIDQALQEAVTHETQYVVIITRAFPRGEQTLLLRKGVVVVHPNRVIDLARIMRRLVEEVYRATLTSEGDVAKTAELYRYLDSTEFRQSFDALADDSDALLALLGKERKWHEQTWSKRQAMYNEISGKTASIETRIRTIVERRGQEDGEITGPHSAAPPIAGQHRHMPTGVAK
jgi:hypothetical protein